MGEPATEMDVIDSAKLSFKKFRPWVEKSLGFRLGDEVQDSIVGLLGARFYQSNLMGNRGRACTDIQLGFIRVY